LITFDLEAGAMQVKFQLPVRMATVLLLGLFVTATALAARTAKMDSFDNIPLETGSGKPLTLAQAKQTITNAAKAREWQVKDVGADKVTAAILVRGEFRATVDISFTPKEFSIKYVSSENLNYKETPKGIVIHANYNKWVKTLAADIRGAAMGK